MRFWNYNFYGDSPNKKSGFAKSWVSNELLCFAYDTPLIDSAGCDFLFMIWNVYKKNLRHYLPDTKNILILFYFSTEQKFWVEPVPLTDGGQ